MHKSWWQEAVVYQIYPRSFQDSNGDGIGDLRGIMSRLDYIKELGVDVIWLCPIYQSPNDDNGYDISDYRTIMADFGTLDDFQGFLEQAHQRGLKVIMDLVVNHTSDEHFWFSSSRHDIKSSYRDYYIWRSGKVIDGQKVPPNNWGGVFGGSAWEYDESTEMYYLHLFSKKQPDLNWENPDLREEIYQMMNYWLDMGIDGFRMDVINLISKEPTLPDGLREKDQLYGNFFPHVANGPRIHEYLKEMHQRTLSHRDVMTVGETPDVSVAEAIRYTGFEENELNMVFQFEMMDLDQGVYGKWNQEKVSLASLRQCISKWQVGLDGKGWNSLYWNNHDQPRAVSRFGDDSTPLFWEKSAKLLGLCLHMLQGTPYIYQGEELGMTNTQFDGPEAFLDLESRNAWKELVEDRAVPEDQALNYLRYKSRDNARTPMQWNNDNSAGFSEGKPWMTVNPNYTWLNAEAQLKNPDSIFYFYQKLIALRHEYKIIVYGSYEDRSENHPQLFIYTRKWQGKCLWVLCNFSKDKADLPAYVQTMAGRGELLLDNYPDHSQANWLEPYEGRVYLEV